MLDTTARLTDDGVGLFDRAVGRMFRRAEAREEGILLRDAWAINDKVRLRQWVSLAKDARQIAAFWLKLTHYPVWREAAAFVRMMRGACRKAGSP